MQMRQERSYLEKERILLDLKHFYEPFSLHFFESRLISLSAAQFSSPFPIHRSKKNKIEPSQPSL